jgi:PhnB protein
MANREGHPLKKFSMKNQIKEAFQTAIIPTLSVRDGAAAIEFYKKAFEAIELMRITAPDGAVVAELSIDGARFFVADESPDPGNFSPQSLTGISVRMALMVVDPDAVAAQAIEAGATEVYAVADQDYGYRLGHIIDPSGHHWEICRPLKK